MSLTTVAIECRYDTQNRLTATAVPIILAKLSRAGDLKSRYGDHVQLDLNTRFTGPEVQARSSHML